VHLGGFPEQMEPKKAWLTFLPSAWATDETTTFDLHRK
jgi:hypothetical protein